MAAGQGTVTLRVLLVDDHAMVRAGLRTLCEHDGDIAVVAEAADGAAAVALAREHRPDVVLMDIRMPVLDGVAATRHIVAEPDLVRRVRVLVLTTYELDRYVYDALRAGASGFLTKDVAPAVLCEAIRTVAAGQALLSPGAIRSLIEAFVTRPTYRPDPSRLGVLTPREREILTLVGQGLSNTDIGGRLFLNPATVQTHVNWAMSKLHARDRAQLVVIAYETGLVHPGSGP